MCNYYWLTKRRLPILVIIQRLFLLTSLDMQLLLTVSVQTSPAYFCGTVMVVFAKLSSCATCTACLNISRPFWWQCNGHLCQALLMYNYYRLFKRWLHILETVQWLSLLMRNYYRHFRQRSPMLAVKQSTSLLNCFLYVIYIILYCCILCFSKYNYWTELNSERWPKTA